ncbi:MAG: TA system VapC family ribonuclease toxin [Verrucomicrobiota bacterium]
MALTFPTHPFHAAATTVLETCSETQPAGFCRSTQQSFLRLITTAALARNYGFPDIDNQQAAEILTGYHELPYVDFLNESSGTHDLWLKLANRNTASPKVWMDAYLAAFAISGKLPLVTTDKDFRQYIPEGLDLQLLNPEL